MFLEFRLRLVTLLKTLAQEFSCKFCEIFKNTFFTEYLRWLLLDFGWSSMDFGEGLIIPGVFSMRRRGRIRGAVMCLGWRVLRGWLATGGR